jgi:endonuclease/exonuclease/phosphatase family metal-dependent hydrolase
VSDRGRPERGLAQPQAAGAGRRGETDLSLMKALQIDTTEGHSRPTLKPEERLLLAVVDSAYWDLRSPDPARNRTARSYFLEDNDQHAFSFVAICQHFSWSPASIRSQLQALLNVQEAANPAGSEVPNGRKASGIAAAR